MYVQERKKHFIRAKDMEIMYLFIIFVLSAFIGYFVVWGITPSLHSPLMSVSNAISGIVIIGGIMSLESATNINSEVMSFIAIFLASVNIFGGFALSERMLKMFHKRTEAKRKK